MYTLYCQVKAWNTNVSNTDELGDISRSMKTKVNTSLVQNFLNFYISLNTTILLFHIY